jgi:hypothetical protein
VVARCGQGRGRHEGGGAGDRGGGQDPPGGRRGVQVHDVFPLEGESGSEAGVRRAPIRIREAEADADAGHAYLLRGT